MPTDDTIEHERHGAVALVRFSRPDRLNAMSAALIADLRQFTASLRTDASVRAVVFTGAGRAFSAGADIAELEGLDSTGGFLQFHEGIQAAFNEIDELPQPSVAAINGPALGGGCELALSCDLRIMSDAAVLGVPEVRIGVLPAAGGTQRLPRLLPPAVAKQMILLGESIDAEKALRFGLVNAVVPSGSVVETAMEWADRLAVLPPLAIRVAKSLMRISLDADSRTGSEAERHGMAFLFNTADRREGMKAFLERREGTFVGR